MNAHCGRLGKLAVSRGCNSSKNTDWRRFSIYRFRIAKIATRIFAIPFASNLTFTIPATTINCKSLYKIFIKQWQAVDNTLCYTRIPYIFYHRARTLEFIARHARLSIPISIALDRTSFFFAFHFFITNFATSRTRKRPIVPRDTSVVLRMTVTGLFSLPYISFSLAADLASPQCGESLRMYLCSASLTPNGFLMRQHRRSRRSPPTITARGFLKGSLMR